MEQMKQATAAVEQTSEYVKGEIARKKAIHTKDMTDLIKHEYNEYYQKALDSSLAYDDLALHDECDLERVRRPSISFLSHLIAVATGRGSDLPRNKRFPAASIAAVLPTSRSPVAGETCQNTSKGGGTKAPRSGHLPNDRHRLPRRPRQIPPTPYLSFPYVGRHGSRQNRAEKQEGRRHDHVSMGLEAGYTPL